MRLLRGLLPLLVLVPELGNAQAPLALNGVIPTTRGAALLDAALFPGAARGDTTDTTNAARYFPLNVGDVWEYAHYHNDGITRRVISGDTVVDDRAYVVIKEYLSTDGLPPTLRYANPIRFDSSLGYVVEPFGDGTGRELQASYLTDCPLNAAWGSITECLLGGPSVVSGGYDGLLVFGGSEPGTGEDTVVVTWKGFENFIASYAWRYAAEFGLVFDFSNESGSGLGLTFARVAGVEHGTERFPGVGTATHAPPRRHGFTLVAAPNPTVDAVVTSFELDTRREVRLDVIDMQGRRVLRTDLGLRSAGHHHVRVDLSALAPGAYLLHVLARSERNLARAARPVLLIR